MDQCHHRAGLGGGVIECALIAAVVGVAQTGNHLPTARKFDTIHRIDAFFLRLVARRGWRRRHRAIAHRSDVDRVIEILRGTVVTLKDRILRLVGLRNTQGQLMFVASDVDGPESLGAQHVRAHHLVLHVAANAASTGGGVVQREDGQTAIAGGFRVARFQRQYPVVAQRIIGTHLGIGRLGIKDGHVRRNQGAGIGHARQGDDALDCGGQRNTRLLYQFSAVVFKVGLER